MQGILLGSRILQDEANVPAGRYAAEMSRWNQEGKPSVVLALWDKLRSDGIRPNSAIYGQTLKACYGSGDHATAMAAIDDLKNDAVSSLDLYGAGLDWAVRLLSHSRRYMQVRGAKGSARENKACPWPALISSTCSLHAQTS
jgi:hypothetical protein